ncbi:MAG: hypothetical protein HUJ56_11995 [Erysipelotrichaceae bacterium]|nr:hypothetical protein [Erysipelotrichaceae bacterium]
MRAEQIFDSYQLQFEKVIFLDVDGVLNDEGENYRKEIYVEEVRIQRLAKIVEETGAKIVMISSWRKEFQRYLEHPEEFTTEFYDRTLGELKRMLDKYQIEISGYTPCFYLGNLSRPYEIRTWLKDKPLIKSLVILDDDDYAWGWLSSHLVQTKIPDLCDEFGCAYRGLNDEHVMRAIELLNRE